MCVEVVAEQGDRSEGSATQVTFVGPFVSVALHVAVQVRATRTGVAAKLTLERLLHTCTGQNRALVGTIFNYLIHAWSIVTFSVGFYNTLLLLKLATSRGC